MGINCRICNQNMVVAHYRRHFSQCQEKNLNLFKFGSFEGHALGSILDISNTSVENVMENHERTYSFSNPIPSISSNHSNATAVDSSGEEFVIQKAPKYLPKYNQTRKLRKQIVNFVNDLEAKHEISIEDIVLNIFEVVTKICDSEEIFGKFGYVKIHNIINYSKILR